VHVVTYVHKARSIQSVPPILLLLTACWESSTFQARTQAFYTHLLITCRLQKGKEKAWGSHDLWHVIITPPLNSQVMHETDFAFCSSYKDGKSTSRELHQAY